MRIGELARQAGVSASKIRFYEAHKLLEPAPREANGYRSYSARDAKIIAFIERAQRLGFPLKEIRAFLGTTGKRPASAILIAHLEKKLAEIDNHLGEVKARRREIAGLIRELSRIPNQLT